MAPSLLLPLSIFTVLCSVTFTLCTGLLLNHSLGSDGSSSTPHRTILLWVVLRVVGLVVFMVLPLLSLQDGLDALPKEELRVENEEHTDQNNGAPFVGAVLVAPPPRRICIVRIGVQQALVAPQQNKNQEVEEVPQIPATSVTLEQRQSCTEVSSSRSLAPLSSRRFSHLFRMNWCHI